MLVHDTGFGFRYNPGMARKRTPAVATHLAKWREHRNLTQDQLAAKAGMSKGNISRLEGNLQNFTANTLISLARALNCTPNDILFIDPSKQADTRARWYSFEDAERVKAVEYVEFLRRQETSAQDTPNETPR